MLLKISSKLTKLAVSFLFFTQSSLVFAEGNYFEVKEPQRAAEYIYRSSPKESLIGVQLIGAVNKPGIYYIPTNTDILKLITLAGGTDDADLANILVRKTDPSQAGVFELDVKKLMKTSADAKIFRLTQDDFVYIPKKEPWISNEVSRTITLVSLITSIVLTSVLIEKNSK
ncbi:MAG: SLBB domain-containing protein [Bdellovibrionaceae bacterium]|nr:SLBB domain-containing protein [Bdellovibrio sp.]